MNKFVCLLLTLLNAPLIFGQLDMQHKRDWPALPNSPNYYTVRENYINYLYSLEMESGLLGMDLGADDLWTKFMRWDFKEFRRYYGVLAAVHAWVEWPLLMLSLALGISTTPLMWPCTGAVPRIECACAFE